MIGLGIKSREKDNASIDLEFLDQDLDLSVTLKRGSKNSRKSKLSMK